MQSKVLAANFITIVLILTSCNSSPVIPPENKPDQPGRRDYTWTVDTMRHHITRIWGSAANDVWAVGPAGNLNTTIWHFDGNKWSSDSIFRVISPTAIYGFSKNNVFIGSSGGNIWSFNGRKWSEQTILKKDEYGDVAIDNIWGNSPSDFYAVGAYPDENLLNNNSVISHYFLGNWSMLNTEGLHGLVERLYKSQMDSKIYILVIDIGGGEHLDSTKIYECTNLTWITDKLIKYNKLYSSVWTRGLQADISYINGEVYFILGNKIAKRTNNQFQTFLSVNNSYFFQRIWGRNSKDIFLSMIDGLAHYNGSDIQYLFYINKPSTYILQAILFDTEVFFVVMDYGNDLDLIYHGKLK